MWSICFSLRKDDGERICPPFEYCIATYFINYIIYLGTKLNVSSTFKDEFIDLVVCLMK